MTRINTIDPVDLLDQHLFIEFREITRIATAHRPLKASECLPEYVLGTGHMKFFYDKGLYCEKRLVALQAELDRRGTVRYTPKQYKEHIAGYHNDWQPDFKAHAANLMRLHEKLMMRPSFYTYLGQPVHPSFYLSLAKYFGGR
jgi:deoxyribonuclease (pyrimidine dimer)